MFTGIITDIGTVESVEAGKTTHRICVRTALDTTGINLGASVCVNGVCLTVIEKNNALLSFDIAEETLRRTSIGTWESGTKVNLERSLRVGDELGGNFVTGHVDGLATLHSITPAGNGYELTLEAPDTLYPFIAEKGSVTLDGIALTVASITPSHMQEEQKKQQNGLFTVAIIPHTWQHTTLQYREAGDALHLEIDILARYIQRMLNGTQ